MTYGELKDRVLHLIFSYSIAGDEIELSYNNQADYVAKIPGLLNSAQTLIYQIKKFQDNVMVRDLAKEHLPHGWLYYLPDDCMEMIPGLVSVGDFIEHDGRAFNRFRDYKFLSPNRIITRRELPDDFIIEYYRRAVPLNGVINDNYVLLNDDEVNELLPWYIAAYLIEYDDAFRYSVFRNEFESRLGLLSKTPTYTEENTIVDVY